MKCRIFQKYNFFSSHLLRSLQGMWPWTHLKYSCSIFFLQAVAFLSSLQEDATGVFLDLCHLYLWKEIWSSPWLLQSLLEARTVECNWSFALLKLPISYPLCFTNFLLLLAFALGREWCLISGHSPFCHSLASFVYLTHDCPLVVHHSVDSWCHLSIWPE